MFQGAFVHKWKLPFHSWAQAKKKKKKKKIKVNHQETKVQTAPNQPKQLHLHKDFFLHFK